MNNLISLSKLFDKRIFRIPDYQRGYAWQHPQLSDFWEDLWNLSEDRYHYTGTLSLKLLKSDAYKDWTEENSGMDWDDALEDLEDNGMLFFRRGKVVYFGLEDFYDEL